ncbi:DUF2306 domain-containing protein [Saccharothrix longispora]|uniref:DUF2306 domain-containing protein n=1 Tax=Saccharothrix longispora TaxID=33920 RepID=UPI0028FD5E37|nr:DUF2306 domain-containing protein [Saccharothrix longispora]MBY8849044.1 DUF2306 domain-containing protein [Saccharothrix sp. MB29]MDU0291375.1 DUF2306 domain-containing protein [Saccharothrix longispora]
MTTTAPPRATRPDRGWLVPAGLLALGAVPVIAGAFRLGDPGDGGAPLVAHIIGAGGYAVLGAFQFAPRFRARRRRWHRVAGRLTVLCGLAAALSGLWLTLVPFRQADAAALLTGTRLVFGALWALFLVLGVVAARRRDVAGHRAWMTRAYAVGLAAGTQVFTLGLGTAVLGHLDRTAEALLMLAGWLVNVAVAERAVRRSRTTPNPVEAR